jgi:CRP/FNR family transcriptional regulator, anaerobic regulatory protein
MNAFFELVENITPLSLLAKTALSSAICIEQVPSRAILLANGQIDDKVYFLAKGIVRAYYYDNGEEITTWLAAENDFIYSPHSFILQKPSFEYIETIEDCTLLSVRAEILENLCLAHADLSYLVMKLTQKYLLVYDERVRSMRASLSPEERYQRFCQSYPHLRNRVPLKFIASYLGTTPSTLSRIRAKKI